MRRIGTTLAVLALTACRTEGAEMDEDAFWRVVEEVRADADGIPEIMAEQLRARVADADDETLLAFQEQLAAAGLRLYTWQHLAAAEMVCGFASADVFTDWRSWVITLGRQTFERIAVDPDALADVDDLAAGCDGGGEFFGAAVASVFWQRHGYETAFPLLEQFDPPPGERLSDGEARSALPRLAERIPDDGLGEGPRQFPGD